MRDFNDLLVNGDLGNPLFSSGERAFPTYEFVVDFVLG
jgi:hypothetical protein